MEVEAATNDNKVISLKKRYKILIQARNFHYENFNKWMSYFYVMIGSIILGFSYIISKSENYEDDYHSELITLALVGFLISLFWHWANKGYYYWNINFITLVNHYEKNLLKLKESERIYFTFANKSDQNDYHNPLKGANISTSKISILLSYLFSVFFGFYALFQLFKNCVTCFSILILICSTLPIFFIALFSVLAKKHLSSYHDHFPDLNIDSTKKSTYRDKDNLET